MRNWFLFVPVLFGLVGCWGSSMPMQATHKAKGKVLINGKPYANLTLVFHPEDKSAFKWDERPQAKTDSQGDYELFTYKVGDGAPAGKYKVGLAFIDGDDSGDDQIKSKGMASAIPAQYQSPNTSGIIVEIKPGDNAIPTIELKIQSE